MPRVPIEYRIDSTKLFRKFKQLHPEVSLTYWQFRDIIHTFMYEYRDYILETGDQIGSFWGFGNFSITQKVRKAFVIKKDGTKKINLAVDWQKSRGGKRVYHFNSHTGGKNARWIWFPTTARFPFSNLFNFKPGRVTSRKIAEYLLKPDSQYSQIYKQWAK